jgi:hypothetical protein
MNCGCIERLNADPKMVGLNARIPVGINFTTGKCQLVLPLEKIESRKKLGSHYMVMSYCPFCGVPATVDEVKP